MKRMLMMVAVATMTTLAAVAAQSLWVAVGQVHYGYDASTVGTMVYSDDGATLTVMNRAFAVSDVDSVYVNSESIADDNILVSYDGSTATVRVAGNIAEHITATVEHANVTVVQDADVADEYTYTLTGSSDNGSFTMDGKLKITLRLDGLTLTSEEGAAINIKDGKRIAIELVEGTTTTLRDAVDGDQKGCFMVNGHSEFKSGGNLVIYGNTKHGFWGDEYVELKKTVGSISVLSAVKDGMNINEYFEMKGGTLTISGVGDDGIQVSKADATLANDGCAIIKAGTVNITVPGDVSKGINAEGGVTIGDDADVTITSSGE